ncbi:cytochrome P450 4C1-like [Leptopilina boulardi]|uniref:cytochrome P450 4C1-like n=1 Tax=Leptopilina boulardi TaxID=63433 RepID=UPI0021F624DD|nr:cytochrome P450 4C1-like [Leptopilina boulardi]
MLIFFLLLIFGITIYHLSVHYGKSGRIINKIPGPKNLPIFGSVLGYMVPTDELWIAHRKINAMYYPINKVWLGSTPVISIYHPDDVQILLSSLKHTEKSMLYKFLHPWLGTGLLTSSGIKWQRRRKLLTPAFHFEILRGFIHIFNKQGEILINRLKHQDEAVIQNIVPILTECTLNSILETAMGTSLDEIKTRNLYGSAIREISNNLFFRALRPWLHFDKIFNLTPTGIKQQKLINVLHGFSNQVIQNRKEENERKSKMKDESFLVDAKEQQRIKSECKKALLDILINAAKKNPDVDDTAIREEVDTFVFEGHDTTAMGACFTILLLAEHKEIQEIAREEVCQIFKESCGKIEMKEINRFSYLDRCIKEALRLFPGVPGIARVLHEDLQLKNYLAPAGTNIHLHIFDLHRDENFWPNPLVYEPNRFLPENIQSRHSFSYIPFSAGPRNCIGQKFAMMEIKILVANLLYNFDMETLDSFQNVKLHQDIIIRPGQPIRVKFIKRDVPIF